MVDFSYEPLSYMLKNGLPELSLECWEKMDDGFYLDRYSPDWRTYQDQEDNKDLGFLAMRDGGKLVGYAVVKLFKDIHQKELRVAVLNDLYITDGKRGHATSFFHYIKKFCIQLGAYRMDVAERLSFDADRGGTGKFYSFMGGKPMEVIWSFMLGNEGSA